MARVKLSASRSTVTQSSPALKTRPYKVVYEAITQEKKKLLTVPSFNRRAPPGFTFVPAGRPELTARCKEYSRIEESKVFVVSTSHQGARNITQHICRIGYHFASSIVNRACGELGIIISPAGRIRDSQNINVNSTPEAAYTKSKGETGHRPEEGAYGKQDLISQEQLNHEARNALTDLFPKIPERDLMAIISRAFKKGGGRVGNAHDLLLQRRVQLAALAHIRHQYTNYDKLVRAMPWEEARAQIQEPCLRLIVQWRGDEGNDENDIEEILREVIVITDDDDDDDCDEEMHKNAQPERDLSVEIISSQPMNQEFHENQISQDYAADDRTLISNTTALGSLENVQRSNPERKKHKRSSTKWSNRYREFRDEYNKRGRQAEDQRQIHSMYGMGEQSRNSDHEGKFRALELPYLFYSPRDPFPSTKLDSCRDPKSTKRPDDARLRDQVREKDEPARENIYRETTVPMTHGVDAFYHRQIAANVPGSEVPTKTYDRLNVYGRLSQNCGPDVIWPSIEDSLSKPIRSTNETQQERHYYGLVYQVDRFAANQIDNRPSGKHKRGLSMNDLHRPSSPSSRLRAVPTCAVLDYGEQPRKRQRSQHELVAISPRYDASGGDRSSLIDHSYSGDMSKPSQPYLEQPMRQQAPKRLDSQSHQPPRNSLSEHHVRDFGESIGPGKHNSNIYYEFHDRGLLRSSFQSDNALAQSQPSDYAQTHQQPLPGSLNIPRSRGDYHPPFVGGDQNVATWGGHPRHLRLGNDSVYRPQDTHLGRTSFHPYFEPHGPIPHKSRHIVSHHYLKPVDDDHKSHGRSLNFQPESNRPSFREPPRLQSDAYASSWDVLREDEFALVQSSRLDKPPNSENLLGSIGVDRDTRQQYEARYSHNGATFGQTNVLVPRVDSRRSPQLDSPAGGLTGKAHDIRGVYREWTGKSDRYYRELAKPIYAEQPSGDFQFVERKDRNRYNARQRLAPSGEIIILD